MPIYVELNQIEVVHCSLYEAIFTWQGKLEKCELTFDYTSNITFKVQGDWCNVLSETIH